MGMYRTALNMLPQPRNELERVLYALAQSRADQEDHFERMQATLAAMPPSDGVKRDTVRFARPVALP